MMTAIFYLSLFGLLYVYVGYPLIAAFLSRLYTKPVAKQSIQPSVTILIAAFNEASVIAKTINNKLALDYPADKLEIIVVSDASNDGTDSIVESFTDAGVRLLRQEPRAGKTSALNMAVPEANGEIIVFSDANSIYDSQVLRHLVANFADAEVGYVSGKMIYTDVAGTTIGDGCSAYMKYENALRVIETDLGSIVGVDGGIDAMRKDLYQPMYSDQLPDFVQPLMVVQQGFRVVYEPLALLEEPALRSSIDEYRMRVRVSLRALWALSDMRQMLTGRLGLLFAWQLWSHKLLRYVCFVFLLGAFFSNLMIIGASWFYKLTLFFQCFAYLVALFAPQLERIGFKSGLITFIRYFALLNLACGHAFVKFVLRKKQVTWTPRTG